MYCKRFLTILTMFRTIITSGFLYNCMVLDFSCSNYQAKNRAKLCLLNSISSPLTDGGGGDERRFCIFVLRICRLLLKFDNLET